MDKIIVSGQQSHKRERYRHHTQAFKLAEVHASQQPDASVARVAYQHNIDANQLFSWCKAYLEGSFWKGDTVAR